MSDAHDLSARRARLSPEQRARLQNRLGAAGVGAAGVGAAGVGAARQVAGAGDAIERRPAGTSAPLSFAQRRQWFLWRLDPASSAYHIKGGLALRGPLNVAALRLAANALVARHESLRTRFEASDDGLAEQVIDAAQKLEVPCIDLGENNESRAHLEERRLCDTPFDLSKGPLLRMALLRVGSEHHRLLVVMHHIIADDWSIRLIADELALLYRDFAQGRAPVLAEPALQYADYALWQRRWLEGGGGWRQLDYWRHQLGDELENGSQPVLALQTDRPRRADGRYSGARWAAVLPSALVTALRGRAQAEGGTLFMALLAGFQGLLFRHSGQRDIRVGVPNANRNRAETLGVVGFFVNTQVLRSRLEPGLSLAGLLRQTCARALEAQTHQELPFEQLVEALQPERSLGQQPLFQVMFNFLRRDAASLGQWSGLEVARLSLAEPASQFELVLNTFEHDDGSVEVVFHFAPELFDEPTIERLAGHYRALLVALAADPQQRLDAVDILGSDERERLRRWGVNPPAVWDSRPVSRLFEVQARECPQATALRFGEIAWSYAELNRRANRLAHHLIALGAGSETRIGIALERSPGMVVSLLAVAKAGACYVPLDPDYPAERLSYMASDSGIRLLLTHSALSARFAPGPRVLELDQLALDGAPEHDPEHAAHPDNLAYIIYTSGSTGRPKGVAVAHGPLSKHIQAICGVYGMRPDDCELQFASINFDGAHERFWAPLCSGGALLPRDNELWSVERTRDEIERHGVTIACFTPGYLHQLAELIGEAGRALPIRSYTVGGEAMAGSSLERVQAVLRPPRIINGYGPTETVITPMIAKTGPDTPCDSAYMPIGSPVGEREAYVLDAELNLAPQGVAGELYLGGLLARGYLGRPGQTAERFVANPFGAGRLYRSGDLARWRADGQLEYLGRLDHQVKVRGFRIELGEVEARLLAQASVREAVVVARPRAAGSSRLLAYVAPAEGHTLDEAALKRALAEQLPDYMVPARIVVLERLPLNPNGKVDRAALPEPEMSTGLGDVTDAPRGTSELALAQVWAETLGLGLARLGRHDNFFELGGDSILSLQIVARLRQLGWKATPRQLFEHQSIAELAGVLSPIDAAALRVSDATGDAPLLPIQADFFQSHVPRRHHWNQALLLECLEPLDNEALRAAIAALLACHDSLRLRYRNGARDWLQSYTTAGDTCTEDCVWLRRAADMTQLEALCEQAQRSLDLDAGPLLRVVAVEMPTGWRLLLVIHHLVVDGVSWRILLADLFSAYEQARSGAAITLPASTSSYKDWSLALRAHLDTFTAARDDWAGLIEVAADLPCDNPAGSNTRAQLVDIELRLACDTTEQLLKQAPNAYRTQVNDILLTALGRALCHWCGRDRIRIDLEGHGREDLFPQINLSRTVGWFTSVFPVALEPLGEPGTALARVKESLRDIPDHGLGFGVLRQAGVIAGEPAQVLFNYLGQLDASFDGLPWRPAAESPGVSMDPEAALDHALAIDGQVYGGELSLRFAYSGERYRKETIQALVDAVRSELVALIAHCAQGPMGATPSDFPLAKLSQLQLDALPLPTARLADVLPLAPMQAGMLFHSLYAPESGVYVPQISVRVEGLDAARFKNAWTCAMRRHPMVSTGFAWSAPLADPVQFVVRDLAHEVGELDWREQPGALEALERAERERPFDLTRPPLQRVLLVRLDAQRYQFIWTSHHLLMDGWGMALLLDEVLEHYAGRAPQGDPGNYRHFIAWLARWDHAGAEAFWRERLAGSSGPTLLAQALPPRQRGTGRGEWTAELDAERGLWLANRARLGRLTLNTLMQGALALLLRVVTGRASEVAFGTTVAGRPEELTDAQRTVGVFINTLPLLARFGQSRSVGAWLRALQEENLALRAWEQTPLREVQQQIGGGALFDTILVFENYPMSQVLKQRGGFGLRFGNPRVTDINNFDMTLAVLAGERIEIAYRYAATRFAEDEVMSLARLFERALCELAGDFERDLEALTALLRDDWRELRSEAGRASSAKAKQGLTLGRVVRRQPTASGGREEG